jgi:hypothetical protein
MRINDFMRLMNPPLLIGNPTKEPVKNMKNLSINIGRPPGMSQGGMFRGIEGLLDYRKGML